MHRSSWPTAASRESTGSTNGWGRRSGAELASLTSRRDHTAPQSRVMRSTTPPSAARIAASPPNWKPSWEA